MTDPGRPVVEPVDTQRARELIDEWLRIQLDTVGHPLPNAHGLLHLRGMIAAALTDARLAGRAEAQNPPTPARCASMAPTLAHDVVPTACALPHGHEGAHRGHEYVPGHAVEWVELAGPRR